MLPSSIRRHLHPTGTMDERYETQRHPIRVVARRTGLSRDVLRAWELRHAAVTPGRTAGGQRLYSDADIDRLRLLQKAVEGGRRIGQVAAHSTAELLHLVEEDERARTRVGSPRAAGASSERAPAYLSDCLAAVAEMDAARLEAALTRAAADLHALELVDRVITPLMIEIGELWWRRRLTPGHERLATSVVRRTLDGLRVAMQRSDGPTIVVATPSGQRHEIGAMLAATAAAAEGWRVVHLGADLPATSIGTATRLASARAVALSLIYPPDDPGLAAELRALRDEVGDDMPLIVGGRAATGYRAVLREIGALVLPDTPTLRATLAAMRAADGIGRAGPSI